MYDQEWELQAAYEALKDVCGEVDPWHVPLRYQPALLALLEVEHCKRRIEAAGWLHDVFCGGAVLDIAVTRPADMDRHDAWEHFDNWRSAAEYAEAHSQGVPE